MFLQILDIGFVLLLLAAVPVLSFLTARRPELRLIPRPNLYLSAVLSQWLLAVLAIGLILLHGTGFQAAGFRSLAAGQFSLWTAGLALGTLACLALMMALETRGLWPEESDLVEVLIPRTRLEKLLAVFLVVPTAAFCEELLYRGVMYTRLLEWTGSAAWALAVSSIGFGLAHAYQGTHGMIRTALFGALLAAPLIRTGSLYPSIAAHFVIDAVALVWLGPYFIKKEQRPPTPPSG